MEPIHIITEQGTYGHVVRDGEAVDMNATGAKPNPLFPQWSNDKVNWLLELGVLVPADFVDAKGGA